MLIATVHQIAAAVKGRRTDLGLSQADLAKRAGLSRKWVYEFEAGNPTAELRNVLRVIDELGLDITVEARRARPSKHAIDLDAVLEEHRRK